MLRLWLRLPGRRLQDMDVAVYRCLAWDGEALYVGMSQWNFIRFDGHADKEWFSQVDEVKIEHWPNRETARVREMQLVNSLFPVWNRDRGPSQAKAEATLELWAPRVWDDEDACGDWFEGCWWSGVEVDPWHLPEEIARSLGVFISDNLTGHGDDLPKWYRQRLDLP